MAPVPIQPFIPAGSKHSHHASSKTAKKMPTNATEDDRRRPMVNRDADRQPASSSDYLTTSGSRRAAAKIPAIPPESTRFQDRPIVPLNASMEAFYFPLSRCSRYASLSSSSLHESQSAGSATSSRCSLDQSTMMQAHDRLQLVSCEADNMAAKLKSVQEVLDTAKDDLAQLRSLISRLERLGGSKNVDNVELKCTLLKTYIEGLNESVKTMPHYYPSKTMFVEAVMALKEALSCHNYVSAIDGEKSQLLRDLEKLRNDMRLIVDENEKLKRRHHKDKKTISDMMERISSGRFCPEHSAAINGAPKIHTSSPHAISGLASNLGLSGHSHSQTHLQSQSSGHLLQNTALVNHREEDLKLIEMLRQVKTLLQAGSDADLSSKRGQDENANQAADYDSTLRRLREAMTSDRSSDNQWHPQNNEVATMDSYFRIFEKNLSIIEHELNTSGNNSTNKTATATPITGNAQRDAGRAEPRAQGIGR